MKMSAVYNTPPLSHSENEVRFVFGHPVFGHPNVFKLFCSDCLKSKKNRMVLLGEQHDDSAPSSSSFPPPLPPLTVLCGYLGYELYVSEDAFVQCSLIF